MEMKGLKKGSLLKHKCNNTFRQGQYLGTYQMVDATSKKNSIQGALKSTVDVFYPVLWIRIDMIHMFLGLPNPDPLVRGSDPDPSIIK
jgi:hypothetical protein